jgi:hypothetical protein
MSDRPASLKCLWLSPNLEQLPTRWHIIFQEEMTISDNSFLAIDAIKTRALFDVVLGYLAFWMSIQTPSYLYSQLEYSKLFLRDTSPFYTIATLYELQHALICTSLYHLSACPMFFSICLPV